MSKPSESTAAGKDTRRSARKATAFSSQPADIEKARLYSFRQGNLAEDLGIVLLRTIAAVAQVPIPEDTGCDAVATLMRLKEGTYRRLLPEDSFYIQIKSASRRSFYHDRRQVKWLSQLALPLFLGSVDLRNSSISLYSYHQLYSMMVESTFPAAARCYLNKQKQMRRGAKDDEGTRCLYLGPPVLSWSAGDLAKPEFRKQAYDVLSPFLQVERKNIELRPIKFMRRLTWETGLPPEIGDWHFSASSRNDPLPLLRTLVPYLLALAHDCMTKAKLEVEPILGHLFDWMRSQGVDPDPGNSLRPLFALRRAQKALLSQCRE
jgi:hypothetical protein